MPISKEWEFQKTFLRRTYNREVNEFFRDIDDEVLEDIQVPRKAAKRACLIRPSETITNAIQKQLTFRFVCQRAHDHITIMGIPKSEYDMSAKYLPEIQLFFRQDSDAVPEGFRPVEGQISFRLMGKTSANLTKIDLTQYANRIKTHFGQNGGYLWKKGKLKYWYRDKENGIDTSILSISDIEAKEVLGKLCDVADKAFSNELLTVSTPEKSTINTPTTQTILGEVVKRDRWRPTASVRFRRAKAILHGLASPVVLIDLTGLTLNPLVV